MRGDIIAREACEADRCGIQIRIGSGFWIDCDKIRFKSSKQES